MVLPINTQLPDLAVPTPTKTRVESIEKISPIAINDQVSVDPRVAVNLADPVQYSASGNQVKDPLVKTGQLLGTAAAQQGEAVTTAATSTLALIPTFKPPSAALAQLIALAQSNAGNAVDQMTGVNWPASAESLHQGAEGQTHSPLRAMVQLLQSLGKSELFAASAMAQAFAKVQGHGVDGNEDATLKRRMSDALVHCQADDPVAKDAARLLLNGVLLWQGELVPGVQARMTREDAWREAPDGSGQMQKGASLKIDMALPNSGSFQVAGVQFGNEVLLNIRVADSAEDYRVAYPALRERLDSLEGGQVQCRLNEGPAA